MKPKISGRHSELIRVSLDQEERYFLIYENGRKIKILKSDVKMEEIKDSTEKVSNFWDLFLSTLSEAVKEKMAKEGSVYPEK